MNLEIELFPFNIVELDYRWPECMYKVLNISHFRTKIS